MSEERKDRPKPRGHVEVRIDECKGCSYCVQVCPPKVLRMAEGINRMGYHYSEYLGDGCTGCGVCFYACPEPGALKVLKPALAG